MHDKHLRRALFTSVLALAPAGCAGTPPPPPAAPPGPPLSLSLRSVDEPPGPKQGAVFACVEGGECSPLSRGDMVEGKGLVKVADGASAVLAVGRGASLQLTGGSVIRFVDEPGRPIELLSGAVTVQREEGDATAPPLRVERATAQLGAGKGELFAFREGGGAAVSVLRGKASVATKAGPLEVAEGEGAMLRGEAPAVHLPRPAPPPPTKVAGEAPGIGTMTARIPNTQNIVPGVRLSSHDVRVMVRDGYARTEVEEVFQNDTDQVLEGRYVFPIPEGGSVSRLALWVDDKLIEGEVVEKARAQQIYSNIVDDKIRPRDPALLDWVNSTTLSLRVFPIPAHGSRRVILAYNQALKQHAGELSYVYPFAKAHAKTSLIERMGIDVVISETSGELSDIKVAGYPAAVMRSGAEALVRYAARDIKPDGSLELRFSRRGAGDGVSAYMPGWGEFKQRGYYDRTKLEADKGFLSVRLKLDASGVEPRGRDVAIVIDESHRQSPDLLDASRRVAQSTLASLGPGDRYVILACNAACRAFPESGLAAQGTMGAEAERFVKGLEGRGSLDMVGALMHARRALGESKGGQIVFVGGSPTSGETSPARVKQRLARIAGRDALDLRLIGLGPGAASLAPLARASGIAHEPFASQDPVDQRAASLASWLKAPVITAARLVLPPGMSEGYLQRTGPLSLGDEVVALARFEGEPKGEIAIEGSLAGRAYRIAKQVKLDRSQARQNPLVPRLWAERVIDEVEEQPYPDVPRVLDLSKRFHVMSKRTSFLVLESEQMFSDYGVERTTRSPTDQSDQRFGAGEPVLPSAEKAPKTPAPAPAGPAESSDATAAKGNMWGNSAGDSFGSGGLGLSGIGEGGGGVGLGRIGTLGHGSGTGTGQGYGIGLGRLGGDHRAKPPQVRMGATTVSGRLPPEVIKRIVRQNFGRFRMCYEMGLRRNPNLQGRVAVRFVIGRDGQVASVGNGGSDMPDGGVVACVVRSFSALSFPQPDGGIVTVTYPIMFSPGDAGPTGPTPKAHYTTATPETPASEANQLKTIENEVQGNPSSRTARERLVRSLLSAGQLDRAVTEARALAERDVDNPGAHQLLAQAAAAAGDVKLAALALDTAVALSPSGYTHQQAAQAFELAGDEARACAHFRAASDYFGSTFDDVGYEAARCRVRLGDDVEQVKAAIGAKVPGAGPERTRFEALLDQPAPAYKPRPQRDEIEATLRCQGDDPCPTVSIIGPSGDVRAAGYTSGSTAAPQHVGVSLGYYVSGVYQVMVSSPGKGSVTIKTPRGTRVLPLVAGQRKVARIVVEWK